MADEYLDLIEEIVRGRNSFLVPSTLRALPFFERSRVISRFLDNDRLSMEFLNRLYTRNLLTETATAASALMAFTIPANYMEPVAVVPSATQISSSLISIDSSNSDCAVCQDSISSDACQIRQCQHSFHRSCILNWFSSSVRCPVCRHDIREENRPAGTSLVAAQTPSQRASQ